MITEPRPRFRPDVRLSAPLLERGRWVHLMLDPVTNAQMRIGRKEHFIISRLDGRHTLDQIGVAYAHRFGSRLGDRQWQQMLGLLYGRALMADGPAPVVPANADVAATTLLAGSMLLVPYTGRVPAIVTRFLRWPPAWAVLLATAGWLLSVVVVHLSEFGRDIRALGTRPAELIAVVLALWLSFCLHELAHGLVAKALGGTVAGIGVRWRLPAVWLYCGIPDLRLMPSRAGQAAAAGAGVLANVLVLVPVYLAWLLVPARPVHSTLGALLLAGALAGLVNLIPVPPFDGYTIIECSLGAIGLVPGIIRGPHRWLYGLCAVTGVCLLAGVALFVIAAVAGLSAVPAVCALAVAAACLAALIATAARLRPSDMHEDGDA